MQTKDTGITTYMQCLGSFTNGAPSAAQASTGPGAQHACDGHMSLIMTMHSLMGLLLLHRPVVVLAEREKEDMDRQLRRALRGSSMEWHTRSGAPHALADLEKVAAGQARTIILMQPDSAQVHCRTP